MLVGEELESLLREGVQGAVEREQTEFDRLVAGRDPNALVFFGAGGLGRRTVRGLRNAGIQPLAFCDNNPALWGKEVEGIPVFSVPQAAGRYRDQATFVITIWSGEAIDRMPDRERQLRDLGCQHVMNWGALYWKHPHSLLPHYAANAAHLVHEQADAIREAAALWADEASYREYVSQIRWRLRFDFDGLADPVKHPIYFPKDLCDIVDDEVFVDCGAYDGDSIRSFLAQPKLSFTHIFGFEPDPASFARLEVSVASLPERDRITLRQAAVGKRSGTVRFEASGTASASVGAGDVDVESVALDQALAAEEPSYIKMDIEGSELDAIEGARQLIERHSPVMAVCSYHAQDHLWKLPLLLRSYNSKYSFFLRPHLREVWDLVCYAVPTHRLKL